METRKSPSQQCNLDGPVTPPLPALTRCLGEKSPRDQVLCCWLNLDKKKSLGHPQHISQHLPSFLFPQDEPCILCTSFRVDRDLQLTMDSASTVASPSELPQSLREKAGWSIMLTGQRKVLNTWLKWLKWLVQDHLVGEPEVEFWWRGLRPPVDPTSRSG